MATLSGRHTPRPAAGPMLAVATLLTLAWFAAAAIAIVPPAASTTATGYGIDELVGAQQLAQR